MPLPITSHLDIDEKLLLAARLVREAREMVDMRSTACSCCGRINYANFQAKVMRDILKNIPLRLTEIAGYARTLLPPTTDQTIDHIKDVSNERGNEYYYGS